MRNFVVLQLLLLNIFLNQAAAQHMPHELLAKGDSLYYLRSYDASRQYYKQAKEVYTSRGIWDSVLLCVQYSAYDYIGERDLIGAQAYLNTSLGVFDELAINDSFLLAKCYSLCAYTEVQLALYEEALTNYSKAIAIYEAMDANNRDLAYAYRGAAQLHMRRLDYPNVFACLNKALVSDSSNTYTVTIYSLLALSEILLENYEQAEIYYKKGQTFHSSKEVERAMFDVVGADIYLAKKDYQKAEHLYHKSLKVFTRPMAWDERYNILLSLAKIAKAKGLESEAKTYTNRAINEIDNYRPGKCRERADIMAFLGKEAMEKGKISEALAYYQASIVQVIPDFEGQHIWDNPDPKHFYPEPWIMTALAAKAAALKKRYDQEQCLEDLEAAGETYLLALEEVDILRATYGEERAKLYIGDYVYGYVEAAIEVYYLLHGLTNNDNDLNVVFRLMEKSKAYVLKEALQQHEAILLANIPETIKKEEQKLRAIRSDVANELAMMRLNEEEESSDAIVSLESKLLEAAEAYSHFLDQVAEKYPQYGASLVDPDDLSVPKIQAEGLDDASLLIEFFWGKDAVYVYWLSNMESGIYKIDEIDELETSLKQFLGYLTDRRKFPEDPKGFHQHATDLYDRLGLSPLLAEQDVDKLLIVTDGLLSYLPFEALVSSSSPYTNGQWGFLLKDFSVQYAYTSNMLFNSGRVPIKLEGVLKVSPGFEANERGLATLKYGKQETGEMKIATKLEGESATLSRFQQTAGRHEVIHLSTHGEVEQNTNIPKVEFIDATMLLPEIYALNLHADLVVLSACETGIGELQKGEGIMSLARGFVFSGAKSLVSSMWKVNEQSTASIFSKFYEYLAQGDTKAEALRKAKLNYMDTVESDAEVSPYFWAGFIFLGNDSELDMPGTPIWVYLLFGGLLLIGGGYWVKKKLLST